MAVNLYDTDEFYDLKSEPEKRLNLIDDPSLAGRRNELHAMLIENMERIQDPFRNYMWANRPWNCLRTI